jgi:YVTN family beta-propeller protein
MLARARFFLKLPGLVSLLAIGAAQMPGSVAYISNCCNHPSTVSVFQTSNRAQTAQWTVGQGAYGAVYSPDGSIAYISDTNAQAVHVIQTATGKKLAAIPVGYSEQTIAISPDGKRLYVESYEYAYLSHVVAIDTTTYTVAGAAAFQGAVLEGLAVSPDGTRVYLNALDFGGAPVSGLLTLDATSLTVTATYPVEGTSVAVTPDGKFLYVPVLGQMGAAGSLTVIDAATNSAVATLPLPANVYPGFVAITPDGTQAWVTENPLIVSAVPLVEAISTSSFQMSTIPFGPNLELGRILFSPDSSTAYVVAGSAAVDILNVSQRKPMGRITAPGGIAEPALSPDGSTLAIPNSGTATAAAIDTSNGNTLASIPVGAIDSGYQLYLEYGGAAVSPDGTRAYITNFASNSVSVIGTEAQQVVRNVPVGSEPVAVAVLPDNSKAYVANSFSSSVSVIDTKTLRAKTIETPELKSGYPSSIAVTPDGKHVYVAINNPQPDFRNAVCWILGIDPSSDTVVSATRIFYPMALAASPDGTALYVLGGLSDTVYTISTATNQITRALPLHSGLPSQPVTGGLAVTPDGTKLFASDGSASTPVFEVDLVQNKVIGRIRAGLAPGTIAITPDGREAWVGDYVGTSVSVIGVAEGAVTRKIPLHNQSYGIAFGPR